MTRSRPSKSELWAWRFKQFRQSELSIARFCQSENVSVSAFYYWAKQLSVDTSRESRPGTSQSGPGSLEYAAVAAIRAPNAAADEKGHAELAAACIRIAIRSEITMFVPVSHAEVIPGVMRSLLDHPVNAASPSEVLPSNFREIVVRS